MKKIITLFLFLLIFSTSARANITEVRYHLMQRDGITVSTLAAWLTPQKRAQDYDGQYYANLINKKIFQGYNIKVTSYYYCDSKDPLFLVEIRPSATHSDLSNEFKLKFIIKLLPKITFQNTEYQNEKPNQEEMTRVEIAEKILQGKKFPQNLPSLGMLVGHYKVECRDLNTCYFSIYHPAKGLTIREIIETKKLSESMLAFETLGKKLARFHLLNMNKGTQYAGEILSPNVSLGYWQRNAYYKTCIHGDLSFSNVFYDAATKRITFIDTETMGYSASQKHSILRDIEAIVIRYFLYEKYLNSSIAGLEEIYGICMTSFFTTYIKAYPKKMQDGLKKYLCNIIRHHRVTSRIHPPFDYILHDLNDDQIGIFNEIMENLHSNIMDIET